MAKCNTPAKRKHRRPHDKPTGQEKRVLIQKLKAMGWRRRDLRQVLDVDLSMAENLLRFREELTSETRRHER